MSKEKTRYTAKELAEFRTVLEEKLIEARNDLAMLKASMDEDSTGESQSQAEGELPLTKAEKEQLLGRQQKFIAHLEAAQIRIDKGVYGICRVTGKLISKERLRVVPHATIDVPRTEPIVKA
jgi:RNA polymerase-binding transcription factor DksA